MSGHKKNPSTITSLLQQRIDKGSLRSLISFYPKIDFSSNDYLGFSSQGYLFEEIKTIEPSIKIGSTGSRLMMQLAKGAQMCVTITKLNAIIVAKSAFNSSMNYESVMIFGQGKRLEDSEKLAAMDLITEGLVPGMTSYARPTTGKEAAGTMIIELPIEKYSLKSRTGGVMDEPEDKDLPIWSGTLPLCRSYGEAETAPDSAGVAIPAHIKAKIGQNGQS